VANIYHPVSIIHLAVLSVFGVALFERFKTGLLEDDVDETFTLCLLFKFKIKL
jgi:hypothetical protein